MTMNFVRHGEDPRLLLVHGLGGSWRSWSPVLATLSQARDVIALDLPGHGGTPVDARSNTFVGLADSLEDFIFKEGLDGVDLVGSIGGRLRGETERCFPRCPQILRVVAASALIAWANHELHEG